MIKKLLVLLFLLFLFFFFPLCIYAAEPVIEGHQPLRQDLYFPNNTNIPDPTINSQTIYGYLGTPYDTDSYYFIPGKDATISIEVLTPVRESNQLVRPAWEIVGPGIPSQPMLIQYSVPPNTGDVGHDYYVHPGIRTTIFETTAMEWLYHGNKQYIHVSAGKLYYINVFEPLHYMGDFVLRIGTNTTYSFSLSLLRQTPLLMLGMVGEKQISWIDIFAILMTLLGFSISIACTFLVVFYLFWNTLKLSFAWVKKLYCILWIGIVCFILGEVGLYRFNGLANIAILQLIMTIIIIMGNSYFFICIKQKEKTSMLQEKISLLQCCMLILTCIGWTGEVFFFAWYLVVTR